MQSRGFLRSLRGVRAVSGKRPRKGAEKMGILNNFGDWMGFLKDRVAQAQGAGLDQQTIQSVAHQIGDYLAAEVEPRTPEQKLLKEMWQVANEQEQQAIANVVVKIVQKG